MKRGVNSRHAVEPAIVYGSDRDNVLVNERNR